MPRGRKPQKPQTASPMPVKYEERQELAQRIDHTALMLCEMLEELKKHGGREELIARASQCLEFGILAALWSLDYIDDQGNPVQF